MAQIVEWLFANASAASNVLEWNLGDAGVKYRSVTSVTPLLPLPVRMLLGPYRNVSV